MFVPNQVKFTHSICLSVTAGVGLLVLPIFLGALNKTTYIQIHTTSYLKQWLKWSGTRDNGTYGICDQQRPKEQLPACRHEANWPDNEGNQTSSSTRWFFWLGFYGPFKNISLISSRSFIKSERKPEFIKAERKPENTEKKTSKKQQQKKKHLTFRKQNLGFPHVTRARLEPQRWEA